MGTQKTEDRFVKVRHSIEDGRHMVRIYPPNSDLEFRIGRRPVSEEATSLDAIVNGYMDADEWVEKLGGNGIVVYSTDTKALEAFGREMDKVNGDSNP
ncbi:hypothetical protein [Paenibacillus sp. SI8]|uniref:hypothetical protein n=1 Tax=unclassified Paenibacillus TaxID=185978 RepID=UPI00346609F3